MLLVVFLAPLVVLAARVVASQAVSRDPHHRVSFPISRHLNGKPKPDRIQRDRKHSTKFVKDGQRRSSSTPNLVVSDTSRVYVIDVGIGEPSTTYHLILDTGSANTWVGAQLPYKITSSSAKTGDTVFVNYNSVTYLNGSEYNDTVTFAPGFAVYNQSIGVADPHISNFGGVYPLDGFMGIGLKGLSSGTLNPDKSEVIPTVTDNLFAQGTITRNLVSLYFEPSNSTSTVNGEMTFGDTDPSKYTGDITYFPITTTEPANKYWGIDAVLRFEDGRTLVLFDTCAGVIDAITDLILIDSDAYGSYVTETGATLDSETGLLSLPVEQYDTLKSLYFTIDDTTYEITKNAQIYPRALNEFIGGTSDNVYLIVQNISSSRLPAGPCFVLGRPFLERFYTVLDTGDSSVGFATTQFTTAEIN